MIYGTILQSPYDTWAQVSDLTARVNDSFLDDPNRDGLPNIGHFALDTDPLGNGIDEGKLRFELATDGGAGDEYLTVTLPVRIGATFGGDPISATVDGIVYEISGDTDLQGADLTVVERTSVLDASLPPLSDLDGDGTPDWEYRSFRLSAPVSAHIRGFMWVNISPAP